MREQFCSHCGYKLESNAAFCGRCGTSVSQPQSKKKKWPFIVLFCGLFLFLAVGATALILHFINADTLLQPSESESSRPPKAKSASIHLEKAEGDISLQNFFGKELAATSGMQLFDGNSIATEAESYAYLGLNGSQSVKLDSFSSMNIKQDGMDLELLLQEGNLFFNIPTPLESDETLKIQTSTMNAQLSDASGVVHASQDGTPIGIFVLDGTIILENEDKRFTVKAKEKAELVQIDGTMTMQISELKETEIDAFAVDEIRKDKAYQKRLRESGWDVEKILNPIPYYDPALLAAYLDILQNHLTMVDDYGDIAMLSGGGLLDFDRDDVPDLVLMYDNIYSEISCSVYSYQLGGTLLFTETLISPGDWGYLQIYEKSGKGFLFTQLWNVGWSENLSEEDTRNAPSILGNIYEVFQEGAFHEKLYYQLNPVTTYDEMLDIGHLEQVKWTIWRDGVETDNGSVANFESDMPEIEAVALEAKNTYGTEWTEMPLDQLIELLSAK